MVKPYPHRAQLDCGISGAAFNTCIDDYNAAALAMLGGTHSAALPLPCESLKPAPFSAVSPGAKPDVEVCDLNAAVTSVCGKSYGKGQCNLQRYENVHFTVRC